MPEYRVRKGFWGGNIVETKCEFCDSYRNALKGMAGHVVREDGIQHFSVCKLCAKILTLEKEEEGWYRIGGDMGYWWYWFPYKNKGGKQQLIQKQKEDVNPNYWATNPFNLHNTKGK